MWFCVFTRVAKKGSESEPGPAEQVSDSGQTSRSRLSLPKACWDTRATRCPWKHCQLHPLVLWDTPHHPALLLSPFSFHWSVITDKQGQATLVLSVTLIQMPKTPVRNEVILLTYHAIDMKITISGNKLVIIRPCFNMWRGWIWMLMQLHTLGRLKSRRWRREAGELFWWFLPTVSENEEHLWILELFNISLCQLRLTCCSPRPVTPLGHLHT